VVDMQWEWYANGSEECREVQDTPVTRCQVDQ